MNVFTSSLDEDYYYDIYPKNNHKILFDNEWLLTDGLGGWASQSFSNSITRCYHSLLMVNSSLGKINFIPQVQEIALIDGEFNLSTNIYRDVIHPEGYQSIEHLKIGPTIQTHYLTSKGRLIKEIFKPKGISTTYLSYQWFGEGDVSLTIVPLFSFSNFHSVRNVSLGKQAEVYKKTNGISVKDFSKNLEVFIKGEDFKFQDYEDWYYQFKLIREEERGLNSQTDLYSSIKCITQLTPNKRVILSLSTLDSNRPISQEFELQYQQFASDMEQFRPKNKLFSSQTKARLDYSVLDYQILTSRKQQGVIAGYHWFEEWGRDTFIFNGMWSSSDLRKNKNIEFIKSNLEDFFSHQKNGLLPNRFVFQNHTDKQDADTAGAEYNSVDSLLLAIICMWKMHEVLGPNVFEFSFLRQVFNCLDYYISGTDYGIKLNSDFLLESGDSTSQLTWMDARLEGVPVTPRSGMAVEINALWFNSLKICAQFANNMKDINRASYYEDLSRNFIKSFRGKFLLTDKGYLADTINKDVVDYSFRPNQIFVLSLPFSLLNQKESRQVLFQIRDKLLTSYGLRTLSRDNIFYKSNYAGGPRERDSAYHQGTVWPWLIQPYCDAVLKYAENDLRDDLSRVVDELSKHVYEIGYGHVSEVFGGDTGIPGGTIAQAWSTMALRYCYEKLEL